MKGIAISVKLCFLPILACLLSSCAFPGSPSAKFKETRKLPVSHVLGAGVTVQTVNGSIKVEHIQGTNALLVAHVKCTTQERLDATKIVAEHLTDHKLNIYVAWPDGKRLGNEGCSFEITLPDASGITLLSSNGSLYSKGFEGTALLQTSNGSVEVDGHAGPLTVQTSNGKIIVRDVAGDTDLQTSNGAIEAFNVNDPIQARSSNGSILLEMAPDFSGEMSASTSNGSIDINGLPNMIMLLSEKKRVHFKIGESSRTSLVSTSNGSIRIKAVK